MIHKIRVQGHIVTCEKCRFHWDLRWIDNPGDIGQHVMKHLRNAHNAEQFPHIQMFDENGILKVELNVPKGDFRVDEA